MLLFSCSVASNSLNLDNAAHQVSLSFPGTCPNPCPLSQGCHPTISSSVNPLLFLPSIFASIVVFSKESALHIKWPKSWNFSFSIRHPNECSGLISFRIDWFDLLAVQGILKSLLQNHSSKGSVLQHSAFVMVHSSIHT